MLLSGASLCHSQMNCSELFTVEAGLTEQDMSTESSEVVGVGMLVVPLRLQSGSWASAQQSTAADSSSEIELRRAGSSSSGACPHAVIITYPISWRL